MYFNSRIPVVCFITDGSTSDSNESTAGWIEGAAIILAVFVVVFVTAFNDWRKERQFQGLKAQIEGDQRVNVIRNGEVVQLEVKELVVGDICQVKYGKPILMATSIITIPILK